VRKNEIDLFIGVILQKKRPAGKVALLVNRRGILRMFHGDARIMILDAGRFSIAPASAIAKTIFVQIDKLGVLS
jgi:hypothetical protein